MLANAALSVDLQLVLPRLPNAGIDNLIDSSSANVALVIEAPQFSSSMNVKPSPLENRPPHRLPVKVRALPSAGGSNFGQQGTCH